LYTELPYPGDGVIRTTIARVLRVGLREKKPALLDRPGVRILDVGCGTGETTCGIAKLFPRAEVVGIDVNPASLKLAGELAARNQLDVRFVSCDLMRDVARQLQGAGVFAPERPFDLLTSIGVLHHLPEPRTGFANIRPLVAKDGLFLAFLYSTFGRWNDTAVIQLLDRVCGKAGGGGTAGSGGEGEFARRAELVAQLRLSTKHTIRGFLAGLRARMKYGLPILPLEMVRTYLRRRKLTHVSDTFSNPCETYYTYGELEQLAADTGWEALGPAEQGGLPVSAEAYTRDPARLAAMRQLPRAALYDYFAYQFRAAGFTFWLRPA